MQGQHLVAKPAHRTGQHRALQRDVTLVHVGGEQRRQLGRDGEHVVLSIPMLCMFQIFLGKHAFGDEREQGDGRGTIKALRHRHEGFCGGREAGEQDGEHKAQLDEHRV
jgi:hypothetical protein